MDKATKEFVDWVDELVKIVWCKDWKRKDAGQIKQE